jgi:hypothetical protein
MSTWRLLSIRDRLSDPAEAEAAFPGEPGLVFADSFPSLSVLEVAAAYEDDAVSPTGGEAALALPTCFIFSVL